jgi:para-nitrobenzyl esterase
VTEPIAAVRQGRLRGFTDEGAFVFLGVPYAKPPFGESRFREPVPASSWDGTRDALRNGPTAPQRDPVATIIPEPVEPGEDYLNLNVFAPELGDAKLPVFVWIHGGGFVSGCNRSPWYRGTRFARDGIVVVNIGYRLGVEGFLDIDDAPSNRALLDWICALEWVQENVAAFGGDPSDVTIGGQSAGSAACLNLAVNPRAEGLFHRVIAMSGTSDTRMPREAARELAEKVAAHLNVRPTREDLASFTPDALIDAYESVAHNPFSAQSLTSGFNPKAPALRPFVDGEVISEHPYKALAAGAAKEIPIIAGSTAEEINGIVRLRLGSLDAEEITKSLSGMGLDGGKLERYMAHIGTDELLETMAQASTDRAFRVPLSRLLEDRAVRSAPTFSYQFRWRSPLFDGAVGAAHCLDIPFAFDNLDAERVSDGLVGPNPPQALADEMHAAWVRFIKTGDPGWPSYEAGGRNVMEFDRLSKVVDDPMRVERELFG